MLISIFSFQAKITPSDYNLDNFWFWSWFRISLNHLRNTVQSWLRDQTKDSDGSKPYWCVSISILIQTPFGKVMSRQRHCLVKYLPSTAESQSFWHWNNWDLHLNPNSLSTRLKSCWWRLPWTCNSQWLLQEPAEYSTITTWSGKFPTAKWHHRIFIENFS